MTRPVNQNISPNSITSNNTIYPNINEQPISVSSNQNNFQVYPTQQQTQNYTYVQPANQELDFSKPPQYIPSQNYVY